MDIATVLVTTANKQNKKAVVNIAVTKTAAVAGAGGALTMPSRARTQGGARRNAEADGTAVVDGTARRAMAIGVRSMVAYVYVGVDDVVGTAVATVTVTIAMMGEAFVVVVGSSIVVGVVAAAVTANIAVSRQALLR